MKTEFMNRESIIALFQNQGMKPTTNQDTSWLMISKKVIRCKDGDTLIVGMGGDKGKDDQIHLVVDAVHLCLQHKKKNLKLIFGRREKKDDQAEVENAVALMIECIKIPLKIETEVDGEKVDFKSESFDEDVKIKHWMNDLIKEKNIPEFAKKLERAVSDHFFKWYRSVTGTYWSGRVAGLEVCKMNPTGQTGELNVGGPGKYGDGLARQAFLDIVTKENFKTGPFSHLQIDKVSSVIRAIAESRKNGVLKNVQREHLLESQVLSGEMRIVTKEKDILEPVLKDNLFQFPTLWAPFAKPRFVDALMRLEDIPYVVELKEPSGTSPGQGYRHAITQAVLYREFVRRAENVHPWFINKKLDPDKCRAVVAFPEMPKGDKKRQMLLEQHIQVGNAFDVEIIEIKGFNELYG